MAPTEHIDWLTDNTRWFLDLPHSSLGQAVPACPGWTVETVITHLAYGVGGGYPHAISAAPDCSSAEVFADMPRPAKIPTGQEALDEFDRLMNACIDAFNHTDPSRPCYTYDGPGVAAFWFRRAAIETTLHRMDVAEALARDDAQLTEDRATDAVAESIDFALPFAAETLQSDHPAVTVQLASGTVAFQLGIGQPKAEISGRAAAVLSALWGRSREGIRVEGDEDAADAWMSIIESAFAGH